MDTKSFVRNRPTRDVLGARAEGVTVAGAETAVRQVATSSGGGSRRAGRQGASEAAEDVGQVGERILAVGDARGDQLTSALGGPGNHRRHDFRR